MDTVRISEGDIRIEKLKNHILSQGNHITLDNFTFIRLNRKNLIASIYDDGFYNSTVIYEVSHDPKDIIKYILEIL
jgi:hypothetical protein